MWILCSGGHSGHILQSAALGGSLSYSQMARLCLVDRILASSSEKPSRKKPMPSDVNNERAQKLKITPCPLYLNCCNGQAWEWEESRHPTEKEITEPVIFHLRLLLL